MTEIVQAAEQSVFIIGASAGGIDALERLTAALPADFAAPIVIAQHLDPAHPSRLQQILKSLTPLNVVQIAGTANLEKATIYVVPSGHHVEIADGSVALSSKMRRARPQPSIDLLMQTAAESYGERVIGVILSGTGTDGVAGVRAVKEAGGTVVVQDPATAAYPALPLAIPPSYVDLVSPLDGMASLLASIAGQQETPESLSDDNMLRAFLTQLRGRSGIDFTQYKMPTIIRRLARLMTAARCANLPDYMRYLTVNPEAYQQLVGAFLIKVTGFFRDPELFACLRESVLPDIIAHAKRSRSEVRIWSAGCATGEEPYSVAILLAELLGEDLDDFPIRIFATDLDGDAIVFARRGLYAAAALEGLPEDLAAKYFTKSNDLYQINKRIRDFTVFGEYDLGQRAPFPRMDLVLCRNVLIYFTQELQQRTLQLFAFSLRGGGYLALGKAETTNQLAEYFAPYDPVLKIFRRQGDRVLLPAPAFVDPGPAANTMRHAGVRGNGSARRVLDAAPPYASLIDRLGAFLFDSPIGIVVIDRDYDILAINQAARGMLSIHGPAIGDDIVHLIGGEPAISLRAQLDASFRNGAGAHAQAIALHDAASDDVRHLQIACYTDPSADANGVSGPAILVVTEVTQSVQELDQLRAQSESQRREHERLEKLNRGLQERHRSLMDANREVTAANNDLRSTNEHLLVAAREAEAASEEVETLNEEMQATSEELETLNEELQATAEELNTTNEELGSRSTDLEKTAAHLENLLQSSEDRRALFETALSQLPAPVALVDGAGTVTAVSLGYHNLAAGGNPLAAVGEKWTAPRAQDCGIAEVPLEYNGHFARMIVLSPQKP
ncbi:MAG: CheR family methyltransferase [Candidatus Baltobacteraceae bacterium]